MAAGISPASQNGLEIGSLSLGKMGWCMEEIGLSHSPECRYWISTSKVWLCHHIVSLVVVVAVEVGTVLSAVVHVAGLCDSGLHGETQIG